MTAEDVHIFSQLHVFLQRWALSVCVHFGWILAVTCIKTRIKSEL